MAISSLELLRAQLEAAKAFKNPETCTAEACLTYWFGPSHSEKLPINTAYFDEMWPYWFFGKYLDFDMVQRAARPLLAHMAAGKCVGGSWDTPRGKLIQVIALDQWSRCAYRGSLDAFQYDELACKIAKEMVDSGMYETLTCIEKFFIPVALSHLEDRELSALHAELGRKVGEGQPAEITAYFANIKGFPHEHEECIKRFGRYPHRNLLFGRESTAEELAWLASPDLPGWAKSQSRTKLTYWNERGIGDMVRFLLEFAMIPYDEENVTSAEQFQEFKQSGRAAFDQVPLLEMDGLRLVQTQPILRYIAGKKGLKGASPAEEWAADAVVAGIADNRMPLITIPCQDDPVAAKEKWFTVNLPKLSNQLERLMQGHGDDNSWVAGPHLTYADIAVFEIYTYARDVSHDEVEAELKKHAKLSAMLSRVGEYEHICDFLSSPRRKPVHDEGFVRRVFAILGNPLPKYMSKA